MSPKDDKGFGRWLKELVTDNLSVTPNDHDRAAALRAGRFTKVMPNLGGGWLKIYCTNVATVEIDRHERAAAM